MDQTTLIRQIKMHPRASLLKGEFFERKKASGTFSALIPHYATSGIPSVQFEDSQPLNIQGHGAEIEVNFRENEPSIQSINTRHFSNHILVQLMYGKKGECASKSACKVLREASSYISTLIEKKQEVYLAGLFILKVSGSSSDGLLVPMGIFDLNGTTIWVNPEAIELGLITARFPETQIEQNSKDETHWYEQIHENLKHLFQTEELHQRILESRAGALVENGRVKNKKSGLILAKKEAEAVFKISKETKAKKDNKTANYNMNKQIIKSKVVNKTETLLTGRTFSIKKNKE